MEWLFASLHVETLPKEVLLTLLHSELPKLYGVLAVLSAIGLKLKKEFALKIFDNIKLFLSEQPLLQVYK